MRYTIAEVANLEEAAKRSINFLADIQKQLKEAHKKSEIELAVIELEQTAQYLRQFYNDAERYLCE